MTFSVSCIIIFGISIPFHTLSLIKQFNYVAQMWTGPKWIKFWWNDQMSRSCNIKKNPKLFFSNINLWGKVFLGPGASCDLEIPQFGHYVKLASLHCSHRLPRWVIPAAASSSRFWIETCPELKRRCLKMIFFRSWTFNFVSVSSAEFSLSRKVWNFCF